MSSKNKSTIAQSDGAVPSAQEQIDALQSRVEQLEMDSLACLKYIRHRAEEEAKQKNPSFQPMNQRPALS